VRIVPALSFLKIFHVVVPIGYGNKLALFAQLHVERGETHVQLAGNAVFYCAAFHVSVHVCLAQGVRVAECEVGLEAQHGAGVRVKQRVANENLVFAMHHQQLLAQVNAAHAVLDGGRGVVLKVNDVLVSARLVHAVRVAVYAEVERLVVLNNRLVKRGQQHVALAAKLVNRAYQQAVILARVAAHNGGTHVAARAVGA